MKKDVIYVDIEDDITSIIDKVKAASARIVALVPPKRTGVLQSVVNLKLLQKAASSADKRVVMITNDQALTALAAGVSMPVAKNLQSKPEVASITALDVDDEDVINGEELPVGDLVGTMPGQVDGTESSAEPTASTAAVPVAATAAARAPKKSSGPKIPNFDKFRTKLFIISGVGALLLIFFVWAIFFAPKATVTVAANTSAVNIDLPLALGEDAELSAEDGTLPAVSEELRKEQSVDFEATGKKEVGERATGTLTLSNSKGRAIQVPAGTVFSASDQDFTSNESVTVPGATVCPDVAAICPGEATVNITAAEIGAEYNVGPQAYSTDADVSASSDEATSGGSKREITIVSQSDVDKAREQLEAQDDDEARAQLKETFSEDAIVIDESFRARATEPKSSPAVGEEASNASLKATTIYTLVAIKRDDLRALYDTYVNEQLEGNPDRKIYASGDQKARFTQFQYGDGDDGEYTARTQAVASVGPNIDTDALAESLVGKRAGEIQAQVEDIQGVENVDVQLSPFWVTSAPDKDKITIKFTVRNEP